jgi:hypothetical protein
MRWEDERYVRLYTRSTPEWLALSWRARGLFALVLREVDRAGVMSLGRLGAKGVAVAVGAPWAEVEPYLQELLDDGCVTIRDTKLLVPNFIEAQESTQSDSARKRASRERARALFCEESYAGHGATSVTKRDRIQSQNVTKSHARSHAVTDGHTRSQTVTLNRAVPSVPNQPDPPLPPGGGETGEDGNSEWGLGAGPYVRAEVESAVMQVTPKEPGSVQAYQAAYERGVAAGRGGAPFAMPGGERGELHQAIQTHARDDAGKALRGAELLGWIEHYAAEMVRWVARRPPEKRKFWPNPGPKAFLRFLNETAEAPDADRRIGPSPPRDGPENASLSPGRPRPRPGGETSLQGNLVLPRSLTVLVGNGGVK